MQFAGQAAGVSGIGQQSADEAFLGRYGLTILATARGTWVTAGEKGSAAGRAHGALAIGSGEGSAVGHHGINMRRANVWVAECVDGVCSLLVGTNPEDIWLFKHAR